MMLRHHAFVLQCRSGRSCQREPCSFHAQSRRSCGTPVLALLAPQPSLTCHVELVPSFAAVLAQCRLGQSCQREPYLMWHWTRQASPTRRRHCTSATTLHATLQVRFTGMNQLWYCFVMIRRRACRRHDIAGDAAGEPHILQCLDHKNSLLSLCCIRDLLSARVCVRSCH
jgi:hypothetical protein